MASRLKILILGIAVCLILSAGTAAEGGLFPDLKLAQSGDNGITAVYTPDTESIEPPPPDREMRLYIPYHTITGKPGEYPTLFRRHLVVVPPGAEAALIINSLKTRDFSNVNLQPIPVDDAEPVPPVEVDFYTSGQFVTVSEPFRFRRNRVVEIILQPVKYDPQSKTLTAVEEINFSLKFIGGKQIRRHPPNNQRVGKFILNHDKATGWEIQSQRSLSWNWPQGLMLKILVDEEGVYKITHDDLENLGLDPSDFPLSLLSIYNNGGRELPTSALAVVPDSLIENAIYVHDGDDDNMFDPEDYILFYGIGTDGWEPLSPGCFRHYINHYTYNNVYWLELKTSGVPGKRMESFGSQGSPNVDIQTTKSRIYREDEKVIYAYSEFPGSGLNWYGDLFSGPSTRIYWHNLNHVASGYYEITLQFKTVSGVSHMRVYWNDEQIAYYTPGSTISTFTGDDLTREGINTLKLENVQNTSIYLNWYEIEYIRQLQSENGKLFFEAEEGSGIGYYNSLLSLSDDAFIFNITDFADVRCIRGNSFKDELSNYSTDRYCAYNEDAFQSPDNIMIYSPPQGDFVDLRDPSNRADYLFITHADFYSQIEEVVNLWGNIEGLTVKRIDVSQIFDQFAWGLYDPAAIRNFLRHAVDEWSNPPPDYVALIGDGDYDYRNLTSDNDKNWIPPYEAGGTCYDDYYAYLHGSNVPEIILGRYTVTSASEIQAVVEKILKYVENPEFGAWRTHFTLVGDDEYGGGGKKDLSGQNHVPDSEALATDYLPSFLNLNKIYLTEYPIVPGAGGRKKPGAADDLIDAINRGTVMVNYYGHGNEYVWADEHVFLLDRDFSRIDNGDRLAIFVAGTCDWAYFDNTERQSFPEELLVTPGRGAIASIAATRPTGSGSNRNLCQNIYTVIFDDPYNPTTIGEALFTAKICCGNISNSQSYHVIGDPMLRPCFPRNRGELTSLQPDSLFAVNLMNAGGDIYFDEQIWSEFEGTVHLEVFDAAEVVEYQFAFTGDITSYEIPGNSIYRGPVSAAGGGFSADFIIPLDITYGGELGRVSVYFTDGEHDGCGCRDSIYIGAGGSELIDSDLPSAQVYFGDRSYRPGDPISTSPVFIADISDSSGINLGSAAGHEIALIMDDNQEFDLTKYFDYQLDSYSQGVLMKELDYLPPGVHQMKFRVWDCFNHPLQLEFTVETVEAEPEEDYLYGLLNYPNPFKDETTIVFNLIQGAEVEIEIYTVGGRKIKTLSSQYCLAGTGSGTYVYDKFNWNGRDEKGDKVANGVYLYKVKADFDGEKISKIGRMILMR